MTNNPSQPTVTEAATGGRRKRVPLRALRRLENELTRFANSYFAAYGTTRTGEESDDRSETIRNALTALAHVQCWIPLRERTRRDPEEFSPETSR